MNQSLPQELEAIQQGCGFAALPDRAFLRVTGTDSTRWLNGMVTNSVLALQPGEGAYSFLLNAQGRIQGDCTVYREPAVLDVDEEPAASFLLSTTAAQLEVLQPWLDRYIIMDDVELTRALEDEANLLLLGPDVSSVLRSLALPMLEPLRLVHADTPDGTVLLCTPAPPSAEASSVPRIEVRGAMAVIATLRGKLADAGVFEVSPEALDAQRMLEGTPLFGQDITERYLPQETGQSHALHFAKGCYLGQEIVERIRSRGQVHRLLTRFELTGSLPPSVPAPLEAREGEATKAAGELTSAAEIPAAEGPPRLLALGYLRREFLVPGTTLIYAGGTAAPVTRS